MRLLSKQGFVRKTHLSARYTSMFEKGLRFERKPRLDIERSSYDIVHVPEATEVPEDLQDEIKGGAFENEVEKENYENGLPRKDRKGKIIDKDDWNWALSHRNYPCPCGSGKKYKRCHGITTKSFLY